MLSVLENVTYGVKSEFRNFQVLEYFKFQISRLEKPNLNFKKYSVNFYEETDAV